MRLTDIGPFFIVLGTVISALPTRTQMLGKAGFYFGFIFFGLDLVSGTLKPLAETPVFENLVRRADMPLTGVLVGVVLTALVQIQHYRHRTLHRNGAATFLPHTRQSRL